MMQHRRYSMTLGMDWSTFLYNIIDVIYDINNIINNNIKWLKKKGPRIDTVNNGLYYW